MCGYIHGKRNINVSLYTWGKEAYICLVIYKGNMWHICAVKYMGNRWHICLGTYWEHEGYTCTDMSVSIHEENEAYMCGYILGTGRFYVWEYIMVKHWG